MSVTIQYNIFPFPPFNPSAFINPHEIASVIGDEMTYSHVSPRLFSLARRMLLGLAAHKDFQHGEGVNHPSTQRKLPGMAN